MIFVLRTFLIFLALSSGSFVLAAKKEATPAKNADSGKTIPSSKHSAVEPVIEDVNAKQLEKVLNEKDYVAVFWCKYRTWKGEPKKVISRRSVSCW